MARLISFFSFMILSTVLVAALSAAITMRVLRGSSRFPVVISEGWQSMISFVDESLRIYPLATGRYKLIKKSSIADQASWKNIFPSRQDKGFLLLPQYNAAANNVTVKLLRISDGAVVSEWRPQRQKIEARASALSRLFIGEKLEVQHPLLLAGGDIVAHIAEGLARLKPCDPTPVWFLDKPTHHAIDLTPEGNLLTGEINHISHIGSTLVRPSFEDNLLLEVSATGEVMIETSFLKVLQDNSLLHLMYERAGMQMNLDPLHLNKISAASSTTPYWNKGDFLISSRHLSMLFIYRPSTGKIIWRKEGLGLNQHDAQFLSDHQIAVLDNNYTSLGPVSSELPLRGTNKIKVFDFTDNSVTEPFAEIIKAEHPFTPTQGLFRILSDGLFFDETDTGRILRYQDGKLLWSYFATTAEGDIIGGGWSRYYTSDEVSALLPALDLKANVFASCALP